MQQQSDIFRDDSQQLAYNELCNALYERELAALAQQSNLSLLQRRVAGLSQNIKRAAEALLQQQSPCELDIHNASWQSKQGAKAPSVKATQEQTQEWFTKYARLGLTVPVLIEDLGQIHLELDSIDRVDADAGKLHLNKHRWFSFSGQCLSENLSPHQNKILAKPIKGLMIAACCGHSWNHKGRTPPHPLSLRELMLSTDIDWKHFR